MNPRPLVGGERPVSSAHCPYILLWFGLTILKLLGWVISTKNKNRTQPTSPEVDEESASVALGIDGNMIVRRTASPATSQAKFLYMQQCSNQNDRDWCTDIVTSWQTAAYCNSKHSLNSESCLLHEIFHWLGPRQRTTWFDYKCYQLHYLNHFNNNFATAWVRPQIVIHTIQFWSPWWCKPGGCIILKAGIAYRHLSMSFVKQHISNSAHQNVIRIKKPTPISPTLADTIATPDSADLYTDSTHGLMPSDPLIKYWFWMQNCLDSTRPQVTVSIHDTYQLQVTQIFAHETIKGTARHIRVSCKFSQRTDSQELLSKVIQNGAAVKNEEELSTSH